MLGRTAFLCRLTAWRSIPSAMIFSLPNGPIFRISRMPITTCANLPWRMTHLRRRSMILNATASDASALVYMNIGTMERTKSTRAISEKRTGSNFSKSEVRNILEPPLPLIGGVARLQIGYRYSGRQDEPESVFLMLRNGIDTTGKCVFPILLEPVQGPALSRP